MFLWLGMNLSPEICQSLFGVQSVHQIEAERNILPALDNKLSKRVNGIINTIQAGKNRCMRVSHHLTPCLFDVRTNSNFTTLPSTQLTIVRQRDKLEPVLRHFLVEDRGSDGSSSYVDFLCHMHKEIRALL